LIPFLLPEGAALYPACVAAGTSLLAVVVRLMLA
jgi:hypothetical protein